MQRSLRYVSGVRLVADPYDLRLWHFTIGGRRFHVETRGAAFFLRSDDGTLLGRFHDWCQAVACAQERAHEAATERVPLVSPYTRASLSH